MRNSRLWPLGACNLPVDKNSWGSLLCILYSLITGTYNDIMRWVMTCLNKYNLGHDHHDYHDYYNHHNHHDYHDYPDHRKDTAHSDL